MRESAAPSARLPRWNDGSALESRSTDRDVRSVAAAAGLELSAHTLRHTCLTGLVRRGNDLVMVPELAGHQKPRRPGATRCPPPRIASAPSRTCRSTTDRTRGLRWDIRTRPSAGALSASLTESASRICARASRCQRATSRWCSISAARRTGLAVSLCALRFLGFVPEDVASIPDEALTFLAGQLDAAAHKLLAYGARAQTRSDHLTLVLTHLGWGRADDGDRERLAQWAARAGRSSTTTTTSSGLKVSVRLDKRDYPKKVQVSDDELAAINLTRDSFHPEWNYTITPSLHPAG